jgi:glycosyltransferase involved in cell wall biosynthesis
MDATIAIEEPDSREHRLRIAMVSETYPPEVNGVARTVNFMVEGLRRRGHAIQLIRPRQNDGDRASAAPGYEELLRPGFPIPRYNQLKMGLPARRALVREWTRHRPDVVHIATEGPLGWSALSAAKKLKLPVATDFHTNFHAYSRHYGIAWLKRAIAGYLRRFHNAAGCTLVPTRELAAQLGELGFERLRVVGRGVDPAVFSPEKRSTELRARWGAGPDTPVVLCVSRFAPEKNFPLVVEAFEAMQRVRPDAKLILVGDGPMTEELRRARAGCVIAGRLVNGALSAHYASADMFLFPSITETFGNVTLEAMASGLGVVAYDYAAAREHLRHGESALLAPFDDRAAFILQAERLAGEYGLAQRLGRAARAVAESITWERITEDFEAELRRVCVSSPALHAAQRRESHAAA